MRPKPFLTLQEARIPVPDPRFDWLCETYKPSSRVPAHLTCIDIAGLTAVRPLLSFVIHLLHAHRHIRP